MKLKLLFICILLTVPDMGFGSSCSSECEEILYIPEATESWRRSEHEKCLQECSADKGQGGNSPILSLPTMNKENLTGGGGPQNVSGTTTTTTPTETTPAGQTAETEPPPKCQENFDGEVGATDHPRLLTIALTPLK